MKSTELVKGATLSVVALSAAAVMFSGIVSAAAAMESDFSHMQFWKTVDLRDPQALPVELDGLRTAPVKMPEKGKNQALAASVYIWIVPRPEVTGIVVVDLPLNWLRRFADVTGMNNSAPAGSGVLVSEDGDILTAYHVVREAKRVHVHYQGKTRPAKVVKLDAGSDLALLRVEGLKGIPLTVAKDIPHRGDALFSFGYAGEPHQLNYRAGVTSRIIELNQSQYVVAKMPVRPGDSGGAVVNERGELVAINSMSLSGYPCSWSALVAGRGEYIKQMKDGA